MVRIVPIAEVSEDRVEQLLDRAFGPARHARTAYRIRAGMAALPDLSFAALDGTAMVATIQFWPVAHWGDDGLVSPLAMLGPVAVEPARQKSGIGQLLTRHALAAAEATDTARAIMLIGDPDYYGRFFGFTADRTGDWRVPGPVEPHRLLARGESVPATAGMLGPRESAHV